MPRNLKPALRLATSPSGLIFYAHLTGEQLLQYFGTLSGLPKKAIHSRIPHVLSLVGMKDARHTELSK